MGAFPLAQSVLFAPMFAAGLLVLSLFSSSLAVPYPSQSRRDNLVVRSQIRDVPLGFKPHIHAVLPDELVELTLAISQVNTSGLHETLLDISNPTSTNYGRHLTKQEVERLVAPRPESLQAVTEWLNSNGVTPAAASASGDMLSVRVPVRQANALLGASFSMFIHEDTNTTMMRTLSYSLPDTLHDHIRFVYPTTHFLAPVKRRLAIVQEDLHKRASGVPASCAKKTTPECLQDLYNLPRSPATAEHNSLYVSGLGGEVASADDLQDFLSELRPDIRGTTFDVLPVKGSFVDGPGSDEANFDIQYTVGLATNVPITYLATPDKTRGIILQDLLDTVNFLLAQEEVPLVLSTSYLFTESDVGAEYAETICNMYAQLGARGTSVIFASGDNGVAGGFLHDPAKCEDKPFVPTFPSTCPFVTSVGATKDISPESAASFSSGGFSNMFPRPTYQSEAVERYLGALGSTYAGRYNSTGRAYPDVSLHGVNYLYNLNGRFGTAFGTSTSTPTFASMIALLNDRLLNQGRPPLGFLNPLLYSAESTFTDVTLGNNPGCGTDGFYADVGWDPATGLGTPDFSRLLNLLTGEVITLTNRDSQNAARTVRLSAMHICALAWTLAMFIMDFHGIV